MLKYFTKYVAYVCSYYIKVHQGYVLRTKYIFAFFIIPVQ